MEDHFIAFIDFLGFADASQSADETARSRLLSLLRSLAELRGEFDIKTMTQSDGSKASTWRPAISTFSDHVVMSWRLRPIREALGGTMPELSIMQQFTGLVASIAAAALRIGFLIRGGATVGKLHHERGVVFGPAMVEAHKIESRVAIYPRVVLSQSIASEPAWAPKGYQVLRDQDGLTHVDYFEKMLWRAAPPGDNFTATVKDWCDEVFKVIPDKLTTLERDGDLSALAKWEWFARRFRKTLEKIEPPHLQSLGISLDAIGWGRG